MPNIRRYGIGEVDAMTCHAEHQKVPANQAISKLLKMCMNPINNDIKTKAINSYASRYEYEYWKTDNYLTYWETAQKTAAANARYTAKS